MVKHSELSPKDLKEIALTKEEIEELERARNMPITFDSDCPELSDNQIKAFECAARQRNRYRKAN